MDRRLFLAGAALCAAVYLPFLGAPFLRDDLVVIQWNQRLAEPVPLRTFFDRAGYHALIPNDFWRPGTALVLHGVARASGKAPWAHRAATLVLHAAAAALLAVLLASMGLRAAAAPAAALFLVHPAHVETMMCATYIQEVLTALGLLAFLILHRAGKIGGAAAALAAALLCKETGGMGLALALGHDLLTAGRREPWRRRRAYAAYAAATAAYLAAQAALAGRGTAAGIFLPAWERLFYAAQSLATAMRVFFLPYPLSVGYWTAPPGSAAGYALAWALSLGALGLWAWAAFRARGAARFFVLWPLPFLAATSGIVPVAGLATHLMADRWLYLAGLGACAAAALALKGRPVWLALLLGFWAACGLLRVRDWESGPRLYASLVRYYPWSAKAHEALGEAQARAGDLPAALASFETALELRFSGRDRIVARYSRPPYGFAPVESPTLYRWLGHMQGALGRLEEAEAHFEKAVGLDPANAFPYRFMTYHMARAGRFERALFWARRGLALRPDDPLLQRLHAACASRKLSFEARFL